MADSVPPPTMGGSLTTTSSSDVYNIDKMNMHPSIFPPNAVYFTTNTTNQDKLPYLFAATTLQVGQAVTHIDSNRTCVPEIITKIMIWSISGDPMLLVSGHT